MTGGVVYTSLDTPVTASATSVSVRPCATSTAVGQSAGLSADEEP
jgi:hypothetical protein